ncbi:MAG: hypothetical protein NT074_03160 [Methanomicrobiales archaeon]|nr:hypothetical protein [Methanomicrobiales archaeon]
MIAVVACDTNITIREREYIRWHDSLHGKIVKIASGFLTTSLNGAITGALERLGTAAGVSRVAIVQWGGDPGSKDLITPWFGWEAADISSTGTVLPHHPIPLRSFGKTRLEDVLRGMRTVQGLTTKLEGAERLVLASADAQSFLLISIPIERGVWGFIRL